MSIRPAMSWTETRPLWQMRVCHSNQPINANSHLSKTTLDQRFQQDGVESIDIIIY